MASYQQSRPSVADRSTRPASSAVASTRPVPALRRSGGAIDASVGAGRYGGVTPSRGMRPEGPMAPSSAASVSGGGYVILRRVLGEELRRRRQDQGRTLRQVAADARVSLGYLSEVERGQKEASSELLAAICGALQTPLSVVLRSVSDEIARVEAPLGATSIAAPRTLVTTSAETVIAAA